MDPKQQNRHDQSPLAYHSEHWASTYYGLADLQRRTCKALKQSQSLTRTLEVQRHKVSANTWQITILNPDTQKVVLQAEGHEDTIIEQERNLANIAEALNQEILSIQTRFEK